MPTFFGLSAMPTTLLNAVLGMLPDRSVPVRGTDRVAVISPMYNEEAGAARALTSLLTQDPEPDELAISINGSGDRTYDVVAATLAGSGFRRTELGTAPGFAAGMERWRHGERAMTVSVFVYRQRTAKSEAINNLVGCSVLTAERLLVVDGDTVFEPGFIRALADNYYRLRYERGRPVLEDYALQSGAVTSFVPDGAAALQRFISAGRSAEYAFAGVLRRGQTTTLTRSGVFGSTRLYTVVGCGFAARRDVLPMPPDTQTEDHDLTLAAQATPTRIEHASPVELDRRGFRMVQAGEELAFSQVFDAHDVIEIRHGGGARFVGEALMATEDPAHVGGYLRQIERWNGGGIQNALKRIWGDAPERRLTANVRFTVLAAQFENVLGLLLLFLFPALLALGLAGTLDLPTIVRNLGLWVGVDVTATLSMALVGFHRQARHRGRPRRAALREALTRTARSWLPYTLLKIANPVSFVAAATHAIPGFVRERRVARQRRPKTLGVPWERPTVRALDRRTVGTAASMVATLTAVFASVLMLAPSTSADRLATDRLLRATTRLNMDQHDRLPLRVAASASGAGGVASTPLPARVETARVAVAALGVAPEAKAGAPIVGPTTVVLQAPGAQAAVAGTALGAGEAPAFGEGPAATGDRSPQAQGGAALSGYCRPAYLGHTAASPRRLPGTEAAYRPLSNWELLMLGRLAPLEPYLVQASTAYDVPAGLLLQVLINESYLDPLAVGETGDKGLSQMTTDALTLLRAVSDDRASPLYNPHLLEGAFNVFDPDFSICAGAAKLRWAATRPDVSTDAAAYALFINPVYGLTKKGRVSPVLSDAVDAMERLAPLVHTLGSAYAAYQADPTSVAEPERKLLEVSADVATGRIDLATAYRRSRDLVAADGVHDAPVYVSVVDRLYPQPRAAALDGATRASASTR